MSIEYVFAGLYVAHLDAATEWYERLFGRAPDMRPKDDEAVWRLAQTASIYLAADGHRAGRGAVTLFVDELDEQLDAMAKRGIVAGGIETAPGLFRRVVVNDPDGNVIQLAESLREDE